LITLRVSGAVAMSSEKEILGELLVSESDILKGVVSKAKPLFAIEDKSGRVILRVPRNKLGAKEAASLVLAGHHFAYKLGKASADSISLEQIGRETGLDTNTLSARLSELVANGWAERTGRGEFRVNYAVIETIFDSVAYSNAASPPVPSAVEPTEEFPTIERPSGLNDAITKTLSTSWGKTRPRTWNDIDEALKHNALHFSKGSLTGSLTYLVKAARLRRVSINGVYAYTLPLGPGSG
jgi:hypothetical protein